MKKVIVFGSCVSRDTLEYLNGFSLQAYFARSSFASISTSVHPDTLDINYDVIGSDFQKRMVRADLSKSALDSIEGLDFDCVLLDFIDERFNCYLDNYSLNTISNEFLKLNISLGEAIDFDSDYKFLNWKNGFSDFIRTVKKKTGNIYLIEAYFCDEFVDVDEVKKFKYDYQRINKFLSKLYGFVKTNFSEDVKFITPRQDACFSDVSHKWGLAPYHYVNKFYEQVAFQMTHNMNVDVESIVKPFYKSPNPSLDFCIINVKGKERINDLVSLVQNRGLHIEYIDGYFLITSNKISDKNDLFSGFGYEDSCKEFVFSNDDPKKIKISEFSLGNFTRAIKKDNFWELYCDYFGFSCLYTYQSENCAMVSNRSQLISALVSYLDDKSDANVDLISTLILDYPFFSHQAFNNDTPLVGVFRVPVNYKAILRKEGVDIIISDTNFYADPCENFDYRQLVIDSALDIKNHCKSVIEKFGIENIVFDLSGGKDSRLAIAPALSLGFKPYVRTVDHPDSFDLSISNYISGAFDLPYFNGPLVSKKKVGVDKVTDLWISYTMGDYNVMPLGEHLGDGDYSKIRITGAGGEMYRTFWSMIIPEDYKSEDSVLEYLIKYKNPFSRKLKKINLNKYQSLISYLKSTAYFDFSDSADDFLWKSYVEFRNRFHFGLRGYSTINDSIYISPILSKKMWESSILIRKKGLSLDSFFTDVTNEIFPNFSNIPYDDSKDVGGFIERNRVVVLKGENNYKNASLLGPKKDDNEDLFSSSSSHVSTDHMLKRRMAACLGRLYDKFFKNNDNLTIINILFEQYEIKRLRFKKDARVLESRVFGYDEYLFPAVFDGKPNACSSIRFFNPLLGVELSFDQEIALIELLLDFGVNHEEYEFALYLYKDDIRVKTIWYKSSTDFSVNLMDGPYNKLTAFARLRDIQECVFNLEVNLDEKLQS